MKLQDNLIAYIQESIRDNWDLPALTNFKGESFQYSTVARKLSKPHILFEAAGIKKGDKIALCGRNSAHWATACLAILTYGAVAVPILHEFKPDMVHHLVNHSGARILFVDSAANENLDREAMPSLEGAILTGDYSLLMSRNPKLTEAREHLNELFGRRYPERFTRKDVVYERRNPDEVVLINYTSGSTGFSKGVMLTERALWSNLHYCVSHLEFVQAGNSLICMLPLAHMYGLMVELLHPFAKGCHINFLTRTPPPKIIIDAFAAVKPVLIVAVPLIIEKIIKTRGFPLLDKPYMKLLLRVPFVDDRLLAKIKEKLDQVFGGNCKEMIIGGAGLNKDVETFLRRIQFPFTVGYGMTECGPLISYADWDVQRPQSCGRLVDRMEAYVDSPDPANVPGVLWVRGDNVMKGYYKNPEATAAAFNKDGWMNTGDICQIDPDGFIYIRGRNKNLILGPSGQNIYPEEIEEKLNNMPYVSESLVIDSGNGKLRALIHPDFENAEKMGLTTKEVDEQMRRNVDQLNTELPSYSRISETKIMYDEFEKTPKRSIKRYLYMK